MTKTILKYWVPPLLWMALIFPVGNKALSSPFLWRLNRAFWRWLIPDVDESFIDIVYIIIRKILHFIEFAILALLLYRGFRKDGEERWNSRWATYAGSIAIGYGLLDEFIQSFMANRTGSLVDWFFDTGGSLFALGWIYRKREKMSRTKKKFGKALFLKRPFDFTVSLVGIILSSPLWLFFSFLVWIEDRGPVFYKQQRVGKNGRIFSALKFRSMIKNAEKDNEPVQAEENDPRVTKIGKFLRATAMDELPQLINILKGDMSFVGPRALRPKEKEINSISETTDISEIPGYKERKSVRPGLTGLAQIYLPTDAPRIEKFEHDIQYIEEQSFWLDLKVIFLSFWITFRGKWESREKKW